MRPSIVLRRAEDYLRLHGVQSPRPTAEALLARVLATDRAGLYRREEGLSSAEARLFGRALCRRCSGEPVQLITGDQGFRRIVVSVRPGVFIPRPETEVTTQAALTKIDAVAEDPPVVVDVGTGTGAIALSVKDERPGARVLATDASRDAVELANMNAADLGIDIDVRRADMLEGLPEKLLGLVDVVVSNPPYLAAREAGHLPADVIAEPDLALFGDIGTYRKLFAQAFRWLKPGGWIVVEVGDTMGPEVAEAAMGAGFEDREVLPDLTGRDRVVTGRKPVTPGAAS